MIRLEDLITDHVLKALKELYGSELDAGQVPLQRTRKDLEGDFTIVVFPFLKASRKSPDATAGDLGNYLCDKMDEISGFDVIKGFLNLHVKSSYWARFFSSIIKKEKFGHIEVGPDSEKFVIEYSSPNTNKPLHLGHIRNNLLGYSVSKLVEAGGKKVEMVNLVNDRGIHICKSMVAWLKWGNGATPESRGIKGDKLVGQYYVMFDQAYRKEIKDLVGAGMSEEEAAKRSPLMHEAQEMLRKWEMNDDETVGLWEKMNTWVYDGFDETYHRLGISFDRIYYESQTYKLGKSLVLEGLRNGVLTEKDDGSVWADLSGDGLDQKLLLRSDGTSVYMTQDLGTAHQRYEEYGFDKHIYVVGNEQIYHFRVLALILKKLGFEWADKLYHLSYGMVELPEGKMKSREGKVVDADDLIDEMIENARLVSDELGKLDGFSDEEKGQIYFRIAMGALKYFILKVDPQKTMLFNPAESIDFTGNTGPFIQYTYVRIRSVERKARERGLFEDYVFSEDSELDPREVNLLKTLYVFPEILQEAVKELSPAMLANYVYELVKDFNNFYQHIPILKEEDKSKRGFRLALGNFIADHIKETMLILGIEMPDRM